MAVSSFVANHGGVPTLFVNGEPLPGLAYITYLSERACYEDFAEAGYRLFSFSVFFGSQGINEISGIYPFADGLFEDRNRPDFTLFDREMESISAAAPDALVFPRVNVSLPAWWEREHPLECNDHGVGARPPRACFASPAWQDEVKRCLALLVAHIETQDYRDRVVGYQISGGQTEEWFPFDGRGGDGLRAREAFAARFPEGAEELTRRRFLNDVVADVIADLCGHVKALTDHRLVVGSFYGYTLETPHWTSCHHSLMRLLASPDVDFLCSPISYAGLRAPGHDFACMTMQDSLKRHGKLYFCESDVRTYLTKPLPWCRPNACPPGTYEGAVWMPQGDLWTSRQVLRAVFARHLTHGHALWWFDMFGGWFASEEIMADMRLFLSIARTSLADDDRASVSELAVVAEDEQFLSVSADEGVASISRDALGLCGMPYDAFEMGDMDAVLERYRAVLFIAPRLSETMKNAMRACRERGIPYLVQDETHIMSPDALRELGRLGGAHAYCATDDVVYVCPHYIALHAADAGKKVLHLPSVRTVTDVYGHRPTVLTDTITIVSRAYETHLFRLD